LPALKSTRHHYKDSHKSALDPEAKVKTSDSERQTGRVRFFPGASEKNCERVAASEILSSPYVSFISHFTIKHVKRHKALIVSYSYLIIPAADLFHFHQVSRQSPRKLHINKLRIAVFAEHGAERNPESTGQTLTARESTVVRSQFNSIQFNLMCKICCQNAAGQ